MNASKLPSKKQGCEEAREAYSKLDFKVGRPRGGNGGRVRGGGNEGLLRPEEVSVQDEEIPEHSNNKIQWRLQRRPSRSQQQQHGSCSGGLRGGSRSGSATSRRGRWHIPPLVPGGGGVLGVCASKHSVEQKCRCGCGQRTRTTATTMGRAAKRSYKGCVKSQQKCKSSPTTMKEQQQYRQQQWRRAPELVPDGQTDRGTRIIARRRRTSDGGRAPEWPT